MGDLPKSNGIPCLVLIDMENRGDPLILNAIGFKQNKSHFYTEEGVFYFDSSKNPAFNKQRLAEIYGLSELPIKEVDTVTSRPLFNEFLSKFIERTHKNATRFIESSKFLGINDAGREVYESPKQSKERYVKTEMVNGKLLCEPESLKKHGNKTYLRANTQNDLASCADSYISNLISQDNKSNWKDLDRYAQVLFGKENLDDADRIKLQEAIEASALRMFSSYSSKADKGLFEYGIEITDKLPTAKYRSAESINLQQYSTPLPISVIAQRLLVGETLNGIQKTILEPTAGNGVLCSHICKHHKVFALELDSKRVQEIDRLSPSITTNHGDATSIDFKALFNQDDGFDCLIANPPFGQMDIHREYDKIPSIKRADHFISLKALSARKDEGLAVVIFGADSPQSDGTVKGGAKSFLNYLYDHYNIHGLVELDGRKLYEKKGSGYNIRIIVIGDKRASPVVASVPEKLTVINNYNELWAWSEGVHKNIHRSAVVETLAAKDEQEEKLKSLMTDALAVEIEQMPALPIGEQQYHEKISNEYQVSYLPSSKLGQPTSMIPINMAGATYDALDALHRKYGDIDLFVADALQYQKEEMEAYFSPEQIDAIGLAIKAMDEGRGIINADQTGMGKGRFLAAILRYTKLRNKTPIFLTIKPELFTDIFRDINDIDSDYLFKKVFIFNDGESVKKYGTESDVLYRATIPAERMAAITTGKVDDDVDMVLSTYSQFMRAYEKNQKAKLLTDITMDGGILILDEAHVASGASNIASTVSQAVANSEVVVYASATPLKGVSNFSIYNRIFPGSVDIESLPETLASGGEALQEAISSNMSRDGVLIRREHDFSDLTFHTYYPGNERNQRNIDYANMLSEILSEMAYLSGDVEKIVRSINKEGKKQWEDIPEHDRSGRRMQASSMNFGSRLYNINRQFLMAIKTEDAIECALKDLSSGRKPVIAVENTGESLLKQVVYKRVGVDDLEREQQDLKMLGQLDDSQKERLDWLDKHIKGRLNMIVLDEPPQFRELLEIMLDRIAFIKVQGRYGDISYSKPESKEYADNEDYIRKKIQEFPDLPLSPIDVMKKALAAYGYSVAEVSGRTSSLTPNPLKPDTWNLNFHAKSDAVANVAGFQNGRHDAIIITRSGSTGISLHATDRFEDSDIRQRNFIVLQKAANIAEFLQWMGRVNRKDQVVPPIITSLESGLPAELRLTMMHNAKLRKLSANTTSNRNNANAEEEMYDLLNDVGDTVALEWLTDNPIMASQLDIALPEGDEELLNVRSNQNCPYINKLLGRLMMVNVATQEDILKKLSGRFAEKIEEMNQRGENPFSIDVYDWNAKIINEEVLNTGITRASGSAFDEPVKIVTVRYEDQAEPIRCNRLIKMVESGSEAFGNKINHLERRNILEDTLDEYIRGRLPEKYKESVEPIELILEDAKVVGAKLAKEKAKWLIDNLALFRPGVVIKYDHKFKDEVTGVITAVEYPEDPQELFLLSKYKAKVAFPGDNKTTDITLAAIRSQDKHTPFLEWMNVLSKVPNVSKGKLLQEFDEAAQGKIIRTRHLLQGNVFRACEMATSQKIGSPILYTDDKGNRQRAVLIKDRIDPELVKSLPIGMNADEAYGYVMGFVEHQEENPNYVNQNLNLYNQNVKDMRQGDGIIINVSKITGKAILSIPGTKSKAGSLLTDGDIFYIGENTPPQSLSLNLHGNRTYMSTTFEIGTLKEVLRLLQAKKYVSQYYLPSPNQEIINQLKEEITENAGSERQSSYCLCTT